MCSGMTALEKINLSNWKMNNKNCNFIGMFNNTPNLKTIVCDGMTLPESSYLKNLGITSKLDLDSVIGLLNALPITTNNLSIQIGQLNIDQLTDEQKAIAINKGWTLI